MHAKPPTLAPAAQRARRRACEPPGGKDGGRNRSNRRHRRGDHSQARSTRARSWSWSPAGWSGATSSPATSERATSFMAADVGDPASAGRVSPRRPLRAGSDRCPGQQCRGRSHRRSAPRAGGGGSARSWRPTTEGRSGCFSESGWRCRCRGQGSIINVSSRLASIGGADNGDLLGLEGRLARADPVRGRSSWRGSVSGSTRSLRA